VLQDRYTGIGDPLLELDEEFEQLWHRLGEQLAKESWSEELVHRALELEEATWACVLKFHEYTRNLVGT
jgi:hypothetical protein